MNLKKILFILLALFFVARGNVTLAASCQCATYSTGKTGSCEQKSESECYAQLNADTSCSFFTDDACKNISAPLSPALNWSDTECAKAKGVWKPPEAGIKNGPYCYEQQDFDKPFLLSVDILGVNNAGQGGIKNLGQYVNLLYKLIVGLAIFFAIIMTTVAGFTWLTAGGNAGKIGEAKKKILNAIIGLILAAGAYTILQTINPRLLELHLPLIPKIKSIFYAGISDCGDYKNRTDCLANRVGVNQGGAMSTFNQGSGTGCGWENNKCISRAAGQPGDNGGPCLLNDACNTPKLKCVSTFTVVFTSITKLCTSGAVGTSCGPGPENNGCKKELKCEKRTSQCIDPTKKLPSSAACDKDEECAGGRCLNGACANDCTPDECAKKNMACLLLKGGPATACQNVPSCPGLHGCDEFYPAGKTFCPAEIYMSAKTDILKNYIKDRYALQITGSNAGSDCVSKKIPGSKCATDSECASGTCLPPDPAISIIVSKCK